MANIIIQTAKAIGLNISAKAIFFSIK